MTATSVEVARQLADSLEQAGLSYAIGGALALGYYATPRATVDVDINIFVPPESGLERIVDVLEASGFVPDNVEGLERSAREDGHFRGAIEGVRVDVFVPAIAFYADLESGRRQVTLLGHPVWILGPEDLLILKMMFFRRKDLADAEAILRYDKTIDCHRIRRQLVAFVGEDDERVQEWDTLIEERQG